MLALEIIALNPIYKPVIARYEDYHFIKHPGLIKQWATTSYCLTGEYDNG